jgi:hypothetical protein
MRLQITFPPNDCNQSICINSSLFGNKPIQIQVSVYYNPILFLPLNCTILSIKYNSEALKSLYKNILIKK